MFEKSNVKFCETTLYVLEKYPLNRVAYFPTRPTPKNGPNQLETKNFFSEVHFFMFDKPHTKFGPNPTWFQKLWLFKKSMFVPVTMLFWQYVYIGGSSPHGATRPLGVRGERVTLVVSEQKAPTSHTIEKNGPTSCWSKKLWLFKKSMSVPVTLHFRQYVYIGGTSPWGGKLVADQNVPIPHTSPIS